MEVWVKNHQNPFRGAQIVIPHPKNFFAVTQCATEGATSFCTMLRTNFQIRNTKATCNGWKPYLVQCLPIDRCLVGLQYFSPTRSHSGLTYMAWFRARGSERSGAIMISPAFWPVTGLSCPKTKSKTINSIPEFTQLK